MTDAHTITSTRDFTKTVTIANGQTVSDALSLGGATIVGLITDANITGTSIKFQTSIDNVTFLDYKGNDDTPAVKDVELAVTATTANWYGLNATDFAGVQYIKLVAGTAQSGSDTTLTLVLKGK